MAETCTSSLRMNSNESYGHQLPPLPGTYMQEYLMQILFFTGPTVGGLLNATCGNATELIIALLALHQGEINVLKYSLLGSVLSNLLLVLGSSLLCGGLANLNKEQIYDRKQADLNSLLLMLGLLCHVLPLLFKCSVKTASDQVHPLVQGYILRFFRLNIARNLKVARKQKRSL